MDNKIKIKIAVGAFLIAAGIIGGMTWAQNRELAREAEQAAKNAQSSVGAPKISVPEKATEDSRQQLAAGETSVAATAEEQAAATTIKKISCSFKAKEGSKKDQASVSWDCKDFIGWTCSILQDYVKKSETRLKAVDFPKDSAEVDADLAETEQTTVTSGSGTTSTVDTTVETPNNYRLECVSKEGKVRNFSADTYWNENE